jgi:hypothetical protein
MNKKITHYFVNDKIGSEMQGVYSSDFTPVSIFNKNCEFQLIYNQKAIPNFIPNFIDYVNKQDVSNYIEKCIISVSDHFKQIKCSPEDFENTYLNKDNMFVYHSCFLKTNELLIFPEPEMAGCITFISTPRKFAFFLIPSNCFKVELT